MARGLSCSAGWNPWRSPHRRRYPSLDMAERQAGNMQREAGWAKTYTAAIARKPRERSAPPGPGARSTQSRAELTRPFRAMLQGSRLALALSRRSLDTPARHGVSDLASDLVERLPDLEADRRRALAARQGHPGRIEGFPRAFLWHPVDPGRAPARGARHLAVDCDGALDDDRSLLDIGLAAAVEILALLLRKEEAPENFLGRGGGCPEQEQECDRK